MSVDDPCRDLMGIGYYQEILRKSQDPGIDDDEAWRLLVEAGGHLSRHLNVLMEHGIKPYVEQLAEKARFRLETRGSVPKPVIKYRKRMDTNIDELRAVMESIDRELRHVLELHDQLNSPRADESIH